MREVVVNFSIKTRMEVTDEEYQIMCTIPEYSSNDATMEELEEYDRNREDLFAEKAQIITLLEEGFTNLEKKDYIAFFIPSVADENDNCVYEW